MRIGSSRQRSAAAVPNDFYRTVTKTISEVGYAYWKPAKGSHEKWRHQTTGKLLIVPRNLKSRIPPTTF
jgi:predicted RNA binding protein YcfA (HicA-like mRNA interferase family)